MEHREAVIESLDTGHRPEQVLLSRSLFEQDKERYESMARSSGLTWYLVDSERLNRLISANTSGGLCGVYRPNPATLADLYRSSFLLVVWEVQDPGNLGTLIRSGSGLAQGGVLIIGGCRPWSAKVARASAGSLLRTPLVWVPESDGVRVLRELKAQNYDLYSTVPRGGKTLREVVWTSRTAVLIGHETRGIPHQVQEFTNQVSIPMRGDSESLNAGVAGSIVCYEWSRGYIETAQ
jgi:RNA methyltransferase, TrmH family